MTLKDLTEISLFNRDGKHIFIKQLEINEQYIKYQLLGEKEDDLGYMSVGYSNDNGVETIKYVDPAGGPFIEVGNFYLMSDKIPLETITWDKDTNKIILTFNQSEK